MALVKDEELFELLHEYGTELIDGKFQDLVGERGGGAVPIARPRLLDPHHARGAGAQPVGGLARRLVDFGHVFSMELEMAALFDEKLFHGEAVAIDMAFSSALAFVRGQIDSPTLDRILQMMRNLKLPVYHPALDAEMCNTALYERVKFSQGQKIPLPVSAGASRIFDDITREQIELALDEWRERCA